MGCLKVNPILSWQLTWCSFWWTFLYETFRKIPFLTLVIEFRVSQLLGCGMLNAQWLMGYTVHSLLKLVNKHFALSRFRDSLASRWNAFWSLVTMSKTYLTVTTYSYLSLLNLVKPQHFCMKTDVTKCSRSYQGKIYNIFVGWNFNSYYLHNTFNIIFLKDRMINVFFCDQLAAAGLFA